MIVKSADGGLICSECVQVFLTQRAANRHKCRGSEMRWLEINQMIDLLKNQGGDANRSLAAWLLANHHAKIVPGIEDTDAERFAIEQGARWRDIRLDLERQMEGIKL